MACLLLWCAVGLEVQARDARFLSRLVEAGMERETRRHRERERRNGPSDCRARRNMPGNETQTGSTCTPRNNVSCDSQLRGVVENCRASIQRGPTIVFADSAPGGCVVALRSTPFRTPPSLSSLSAPGSTQPPRRRRSPPWPAAPTLSSAS